MASSTISRLDAADLVGVGEQEAVIADRVDEARDPAAVRGDPSDRLVGEEPEVARAGDPEPGPDVVADLLGRRGAGCGSAARCAA